MNALGKWTIAIILLLVFGVVFLDRGINGALQSTGFAQTRALVGVPKKVRVGDQRFQIPSNYTFAPLEVTGHDGDFDIIRAIAVQGLTPDFEPLTRNNSKRFDEPLCCFRVLITPMAVSPSIFMSRTLDRWFKTFEVLSQEHNAGVTHYEVRSPHHLFLISQYGDLYIDDDHLQAVICNRRDIEGIRHIVNITCDVYRPQNAELYQITLPSNDPSLRDRQLKIVWDVIHSWMR